MERLKRKGDEKLYQPKILSEKIRELHRISEEVHKPMTVVLDVFLTKCIEAYVKQKAEKEALQDEHFFYIDRQIDERLENNDLWQND